MVNNLSDLDSELREEVQHRSSANNIMKEEAFTEVFCDYLIEFGELDTFEPSAWRDKNVGAKIDAYSFDDDIETINLVTSIWKEDGSNVTNSELDTAIKRARKFFSLSIQGKLPGDRIDVGNAAHDLASTIYEVRKELTTIRVIVVTNGETKPREGTSEKEDGKSLQVVVWDGPRLLGNLLNTARVGLTIDFQEYGGPVKCVKQQDTGKYTTYLAFVSGQMLSDLYSTYKTRLLEKNVRVFLQQRGNVNKGIRNTIINEPEMFCAYNNGITVYAESIIFEEIEDGIISLSLVEDFQIVNGGQTTASLYHTMKKDKAELDKISVQMKLMVIHNNELSDEKLSDELVPKISQYSNTQNKIQMSDLRANDKPHPELFAISKKALAPDPTGGTKTTYWFYEKSRGAYGETRNTETNTHAQRKSFDSKYPRSQRFDKGKFSKVWYSYLRKPQIVALGPQKCFARFHTDFLSNLVSEGETDWPTFFRKTIGLLLLWNAIEKEIGRRKRQGIYIGFNQNIIAYTLSLFSHQTKQKIDLEQIWDKQTIPEDMMEYLLTLADTSYEHIIKLPKGQSLVPEYCKKEACWDSLINKKNLPRAPPSLKKYLHSNQKRMKVDESQDEINIQFCQSKGADAWFDLSKWMKEKDWGVGKQRSQCFNMGKILAGKRKPSSALSFACKKVWDSMEQNYGWDK